MNTTSKEGDPQAVWCNTIPSRDLIRDYWVFGHCPSSGILKNTTFRKLDVFPSSGEGLGSTYLFESVKKS
jgi:hypothetical protein